MKSANAKIHHQLLLLLTALCAPATSQSPADVLRLYQPNTANEARLVDTSGTIVHRWPTQVQPAGIDLQDDGTLIYGTQSGVHRRAFDGTLLWAYSTAPGVSSHHDLEPLPNGNVLLITWDDKTREQAVSQGRNPELIGTPFLLPDQILEVQATGPTSGIVVWEWHVWDHLIQDHDPTKANYGVVADHPELIDINYPPVPFACASEAGEAGDGLARGWVYNHTNGIDYDPIHDWILLSPREQGEIWIIDHSTTTAEAAGHSGGRWGKGGDLLYRWGNPAAYRAGPASARVLVGQHAPRFIPTGYPGAGNVTLFNNCVAPGRSEVFEIVLPVDPSGRFVMDPSGSYGPAAPVWTYTSPALYSSIQSSAQRLPNGNTLICSAEQGWIFEVTAAGQLVWEHNGGRGLIFHAHHTQRTLWASTDTVPAATGGRVDFNLLAGTPAADDVYVVLCSASGTTPGTVIAGVTLPLNVDPFLFMSLEYANVAPLFIRTWGVMGRYGQASAAFTLPAMGVPSGFSLDFAYLRYRLGFKAASNPVHLRAL